MVLVLLLYNLEPQPGLEHYCVILCFYAVYDLISKPKA